MSVYEAGNSKSMPLTYLVYEEKTFLLSFLLCWLELYFLLEEIK